MKTKKTLLATTVNMRHGSEGPRYDPYAFTEITVTRNGISYTLHEGLGVWLKVDGQIFEVSACGMEHEDAVAGKFTEMTGMTPIQWEKAYNRVHPYVEDPMGSLSDYV